MKNRRPRLLDLFCGAGGAGTGYYRAGFDVFGVDIKKQNHYPFDFIQCDAITFLRANGSEFDAIHASPPCQRFSSATRRWGRSEDHPDLIAPTRKIIQRTGKPYVIENVVGSPLIDPLLLCGSMFDLSVRRHRLFECSFDIQQPSCQHLKQGRIITVTGHSGGSSIRDGIVFGAKDEWERAMGIDWMVVRELALAIPPAYTTYIGERLLHHVMQNH